MAMRWFKHLSTSFDDEDMALLVEKFGLEGYGLWWRILEIIAGKMEKGCDCACATFPRRKWRNLCCIYHQSRFDLITIFLASRGKLSIISDESNRDLLTISCPNLLKYRDEYSKKSGQTPDNHQSRDGQTPKQETHTEVDNTEKEKTSTTTLEAGSPDQTNGSRGGSGDSFRGDGEDLPEEIMQCIEGIIKLAQDRGTVDSIAGYRHALIVRYKKGGTDLQKGGIDTSDYYAWQKRESERAEQAERRQEEDRKAEEKRQELALQAEAAAKDRRLREEQAREQQAKDRPHIAKMCREYLKAPQSRKEIIE